MVTQRVRLLASILFACAAVAAQQPNSAGASAIWDGIDGPPWPITVTATPAGNTVSFVVSGAPNQAFLVALAPAGVVGTGLPMAFGNVDLDFSNGYSLLVDPLFGN